MAFLEHLLHGPWLPLARVTLFSHLVRSLDHIPRITATSCSIQPRNRVRGWEEFWHCAATTTTTTTPTLHPTTAILRRTSPVPSTCCTCCAFKGNIHHYSAFTAKCTCAAVPSGGIRIHTGDSATTAYRQDLWSLRSSSDVGVLSEMRVRGHDRLMYRVQFDGAYGNASQLTRFGSSQLEIHRAMWFLIRSVMTGREGSTSYFRWRWGCTINVTNTA